MSLRPAYGNHRPPSVFHSFLITTLETSIIPRIIEQRGFGKDEVRLEIENAEIYIVSDEARFPIQPLGHSITKSGA